MAIKTGCKGASFCKIPDDKKCCNNCNFGASKNGPNQSEYEPHEMDAWQGFLNDAIPFPKG